MKIGIYLAYHPIKHFSLKQEGLGRYLSYIVKAFIENNHNVVIACPSWTVEAIDELFEEENINRDNVELLVSKSEPIMLRLYMKLIERKSKKKKEKKSHFRIAALKGMDIIIDKLILIKNHAQFALVAFILATLGIALAIIALPFLAVVFIVMTVINGIFTLFHINKKTFKFINIFSLIKRKSVFVSMICNHISQRYLMQNRAIYKIRENAAKDIIRKINSMKTPADIWYSPMAFWPEFNSVPGNRVVCAPDLVVSEFATNFSIHKDISIGVDNVRKTLQGGQYFITYCDYLKNSLVVDQLRKDEKNVISIPHAINDMSISLDINKEYINQFGDISKKFSRMILQTIKSNVVNVKEYISSKNGGFSFQDVEYLFYASQIRGNKNVFTLIKAYEYLLRKKFYQIKLFLTCDINVYPEIKKYIYDKRLQYDVLCFHGVTSQQLSALYSCAKLVVNPTLYEGGFPFTFGEGMSVGTPSVMSKIPQVMEVIEGYGLEEYFFDPYDYLDIAHKIDFGLSHLEELFDKEKILFDDLNKRTWTDVGKEYVRAFNYFIDLSRAGV